MYFCLTHELLKSNFFNSQKNFVYFVLGCTYQFPTIVLSKHMDYSFLKNCIYLLKNMDYS